MQKRKKKRRKKKLSADGGMTLEQIQYLYPKAVKMRKGYINLSSEEKKHIIEWMLRKGMKPFYAFVILEIVLTLIMVILEIMDTARRSIPMFSVGIIVFATSVSLLIYVLLKRRNRKQLNSIDFNKVEEVFLISNSGGTQYVSILRWDEEKELFYIISTHSDLYLTVYEEVIYHPYGTQLFIPKRLISDCRY